MSPPALASCHGSLATFGILAFFVGRCMEMWGKGSDWMILLEKNYWKNVHFALMHVDLPEYANE